MGTSDEDECLDVAESEVGHVQFLSGSQISSEVKRMVRSSPWLDFAVAYWGRSAGDILGLKSRPNGSPIRILCDLTSGGTNPAEIENILTELLNVRVKHCSGLHAKVYISEDAVLVGSANASTNGLRIEGQIASDTLEEAALISREDACRRAVKNWFERHWNSRASLYVTLDSDCLAAAKRAYALSRDAAGDRPRENNRVTLRQLVRGGWGVLKEVPVFVSCWAEDHSNDAKTIIEETKKNFPRLRKFEPYEEARRARVKAYPRGAYLIDAKWRQNSKVSVDGRFWFVRDWDGEDRWIVQKFKYKGSDRPGWLVWVDPHPVARLASGDVLFLDADDKQLLRELIRHEASKLGPDGTVHLHNLFTYAMADLSFARHVEKLVAQ